MCLYEVYTECSKIYRKSVLHLLKLKFAVYLSRYITYLLVGRVEDTDPSISVRSGFFFFLEGRFCFRFFLRIASRSGCGSGSNFGPGPVTLFYALNLSSFQKNYFHSQNQTFSGVSKGKLGKLAIFYHAKNKIDKFTFSIVFISKKNWIESTPPPPPIKKAQF